MAASPEAPSATEALRDNEAKPVEKDATPEVDYTILNNMDPIELNKILEDNQEVKADTGLKKQLLSKKKLFADTYH